MIGYDEGRKKSSAPLGSYIILLTMMGVFILFIILLSPHGCEGADRWTKGDTVRESAWQAIHVLDYLQTRQIAKHPEAWSERNPFLGKHPTEEKVMVYFACGAVLHLGIAYLLPKDYREAFQYVTILFSAGVVATNYGMGLKFAW